MTLLSIDEKNRIFDSFPKTLKLKQHKNTHYLRENQDFYLFIPKGQKFFVWFKNEEPNKCYFLRYKERKFIDCRIKHVSVDKKLFNNTIVYGTLIKNKFIIEDIMYFKNKYVYDESFQNKCKKYFKNLFVNEQYDCPPIDIRSFVQFKIIPFEVNYSLVSFKQMNIQFPIYEIIQVKHNKMERFNLFHKCFTFKCLPSLKNDIYNLYVYCHDKGDFILYDTALVNDYYTSKFMNSLFGLNYKENKNIDNIEMSDSEDDEDEDDIIYQKSKIINDNSGIFVKCYYNNKFKRWKPMEKSHLKAPELMHDNTLATLEKIKNYANKA